MFHINISLIYKLSFMKLFHNNNHLGIEHYESTKKEMNMENYK